MNLTYEVSDYSYSVVSWLQKLHQIQRRVTHQYSREYTGLSVGSLGITLPNVRGPGDWAAKIAGLKEGYPLVYKAIMQATLRDATTAQDKRRAIMVMHEQADRLLGARSSLERVFSGTGTIYQALHASR